MSKSVLRTATLAVLAVILGTSAQAAVSRIIGPTTLLGDGRGLVKFDAAYDSIHRVYLVAYGTQAAGPVNGILVNESGVAVTGLFPLSDGAQQCGWARVIFSPEQGKFLVSYIRIVASGHHQKVARFVTVANNAATLGAEMILDDWIGGAGTATGMAYAAPSGKFFVTWSRYDVGAAGAPFVTNTFVSVITPAGVASAPIRVSSPWDGESDPEIACDPAGRRCLILGTAWGIGTGGKSSFWARFIDDTTGAPQGPDAFYPAVWGGLMDPPAIVYSAASQQFLLGVGMGGKIYGMIGSSASSSVTAPFVMLQDTVGNAGVGYGFLSLRYNPSSQTTIGTFTTWTGLAAVQEFDGNGNRVASGFDLIPDTPEVASKPWDTANQFTVPATNPNTSGFAVFEDHYFKAIRGSIYSGTGGGPVVPASTQAPTVTTQPANQTANNGQLITFSAAASGNPAPTVQWQVRNVGSATWADIGGATSTSYAFWAAPRDNNKQVRAVFSNSAGSATSNGATIRVAGLALSDFDGDGRGDFLVWRPTNGTWYWSSSSLLYADGGSKQFGNQGLGDVPMKGDIDGDGLADAIVWRATDGTWYWSTSSSRYTNGGSRQWGNQGYGDVPLMADLDGDGKSDLVIWRASTGMWYWLTSSSGFTAGFSRQWGNSGLGDQPLLGDFDGDGKADPAVWRASTGMWYWLTSTSNLTNGFMKQFGNSGLGDIPLVSDMDGDGVSDLVIWRNSTGDWHWSTSSSGFTAGNSVHWGAPGDKPLLSDIDGDGKADPIVWRPSEGNWYWTPSSANYAINASGVKQFGNQAFGDIPLIK